MKTLKILLVVLASIQSTILLSQELKYQDLAPGNPMPKGEYTSYISKSGTVFKIGDKLKIGVPSKSPTFFTYIQRTGCDLKTYQLDAMEAGSEVEIFYFFIYGDKKKGYHVTLKAYGKRCPFWRIILENAIETGEVVTNTLSSDQALSELKKAKEKLDLNLISQYEYDSLKIVYSKYIK